MARPGPYVHTALLGLVFRRYPRQPAPLICEGKCNCITIHVYSGRKMYPIGHCVFKDLFEEDPKPCHLPCFHDMYQCLKCSHKRIWG